MNVKDFKVGDYVVPSKDWNYNDQAEGSCYGIITSIDEKFYEDNNLWCTVMWIDYKGNEMTNNSYRIGPVKFDVELYSEQ